MYLYLILKILLYKLYMKKLNMILIMKILSLIIVGKMKQENIFKEHIYQKVYNIV